MTPNRDTTLLKPELQKRLLVLFSRYRRLHPEAPQPFVTEGWRSIERQTALFAQGRTAPGPIVTWTMNSKHLTGDAFDVAFNDPRGAYACTVCFERLGSLAADAGLEWGGTWPPNQRDLPHFELSPSLTIKPLDLSGQGIQRVYLNGKELNVDLLNRIGSKLYVTTLT